MQIDRPECMDRPAGSGGPIEYFVDPGKGDLNRATHFRYFASAGQELRIDQLLDIDVT